MRDNFDAVARVMNLGGKLGIRLRQLSARQQSNMQWLALSSQGNGKKLRPSNVRSD